MVNPSQAGCDCQGGVVFPPWQDPWVELARHSRRPEACRGAQLLQRGKGLSHHCGWEGVTTSAGGISNSLATYTMLDRMTYSENNYAPPCNLPLGLKLETMKDWACPRLLGGSRVGEPFHLGRKASA